MKRWALLTFVTATVLVSCKKEKPGPTCERTMAGISGSYKLQTIEYKATPAATPVDLSSTIDPCEIDDIIQLNSNGSWTYTDAGAMCTPPADDSGTWTLNGAQITSDGTVTGTIQSYDCRNLVVYLDNLLVPGDRWIQTFVKQ